MLLSWKKTNIFLKIYTTQSDLHIKCIPYQKHNGLKKKKKTKIHMEPKWTLNSKSILGKNKYEDLTLPDFKSYYKAITN